MSVNQTYTLTLGDQAENHVGMQKIGELAKEGFELQDLKKAQAWFDKRGGKAVIHELHQGNTEQDPAYVLVVKHGLDVILASKHKTSAHFFKEQAGLPKDDKALMYGRVVNKHARHNLCFAEDAQEPDYQNGKGRIVAFKDVPLLKYVIDKIPEIIGDKGDGLVAEGNYYYDVTKCGIGFHGDTERRKVVGIRVGASLPLHYQWFQEGKPIGERIIIPLDDGDVYFMSHKATGNDWKKKKIATLRHATGAKKFITIPE
jgi:hypothetical protein